MAGKAQKAGKSKRPQSEKKKMLRAACRRDAQKRHEANAREQERRHQRNLQGDSAPWELACMQRADRRLKTCGSCRVPFREDREGQLRCPQCHGTQNLKATWEKRGKQQIAA